MHTVKKQGRTCSQNIIYYIVLYKKEEWEYTDNVGSLKTHQKTPNYKDIPNQDHEKILICLSTETVLFLAS